MPRDQEEVLEEFMQMELGELLSKQEDPNEWWRQQVAEWPENLP